MRTNIEINDRLMAEVLKDPQIKTKKDAVEKGLELILRMRDQTKILQLRGKIQFDDEAYK